MFSYNPFRRLIKVFFSVSVYTARLREPRGGVLLVGVSWRNLVNLAVSRLPTSDRLHHKVRAR